MKQSAIILLVCASCAATRLATGASTPMYVDTRFAPYTSAVVADGNWVNVQGDLLPSGKAILVTRRP